MLTVIRSSVPMGRPPAWAVLQRRLLESFEPATRPYVDKYVAPDGSLIWLDSFDGRDGLDDAYEAFQNWPLAYSLGGSRQLLDDAYRGWHGVTRQFTRYGQVLDEYERGYDWFHQGEGNLLLYGLGLAEPQKWRTRLTRFADLYSGTDAENFDSALGIIRAAHTGSGGPRLGPYNYSHPFDEERSVYRWSQRHAAYGLPLRDVPGISRFEDLKDEALARRMGEAMNARMAPGDTAVNLGSTSLVTMAYLVSGDERHRRWVLDYVERWLERARRNNGILPDNVGPSGIVGENHGGDWFGGSYGWAWPHGLETIASAAIVGASCAYLLSADDGYLELPRKLLDAVLERGRVEDGRLLVPNRHNRDGWFDFKPMEVRFPAALWNLTGRADDWGRVEYIQQSDSNDWSAIDSESGRFGSYAEPWHQFLSGRNPDYPAQVLAESLAHVNWKADQVRSDSVPYLEMDIHHWQQMNPVTTEALAGLTLGSPNPIYNGGLLHAKLLFEDIDVSRQGLPADTAALVTSVTSDRIEVTLVNLDPVNARRLRVHGGAFDELVFQDVIARQSDDPNYPGMVGTKSRPRVATRATTTSHRSSSIDIELAPGTQLEMALNYTRCPAPARST